MDYEDWESLDDACREWQEILRLRDWDIHMKLVRGWELGTPLARSNTNLDDNRAVISLVEWRDIPDNLRTDAAFADMEHSLVHELLHVMFRPFEDKVPDDSLEHQFVEQAINKLAYALVKLKRLGGP